MVDGGWWMDGVILSCQNEYYNSNIKVLLIVVKVVKNIKVLLIGNIIDSSK